MRLLGENAVHGSLGEQEPCRLQATNASISHMYYRRMVTLYMSAGYTG